MVEISVMDRGQWRWVRAPHTLNTLNGGYGMQRPDTPDAPPQYNETDSLLNRTSPRASGRRSGYPSKRKRAFSPSFISALTLVLGAVICLVTSAAIGVAIGQRSCRSDAQTEALIQVLRRSLAGATTDIQHLASANQQLNQAFSRATAEVQHLTELNRELEHAAEERMRHNFMQWVRQQGVGGDSWVNSDETAYWTFGHSGMLDAAFDLQVLQARSPFTDGSSYHFQAGYDGVPFEASVIGFRVDARGPPYHNGKWVRRIAGDTFGGKEIQFIAAGGSYVATVLYVVQTPGG